MAPFREVSIMRRLYYTHNINPRVAVATARYLKAPVEYLRIAPKGADEEMIRQFNPNTLAPVLVEDDGTSLWETDAITLRLAKLTGSDFWQLDRLDEMLQWVSWSAHHFTRAGGTYTFENVTMVNVPAGPGMSRRLLRPRRISTSSARSSTRCFQGATGWWGAS
jgi:glutathione S-transferase